MQKKQVSVIILIIATLLSVILSLYSAAASLNSLSNNLRYIIDGGNFESIISSFNAVIRQSMNMQLASYSYIVIIITFYLYFKKETPTLSWVNLLVTGSSFAAGVFSTIAYRFILDGYGYEFPLFRQILPLALQLVVVVLFAVTYSLQKQEKRNLHRW